MIFVIVDTAMRIYRDRCVFLDGARERIIFEVGTILGKAPHYKNQVISAIELAIKNEVEFSSGHPLMESMFYDMGS